MESFQKLIEVAKTLNGPKGCPWDVKQTFRTLAPFLLEEVHELLEAVDNDKNHEVLEELGDIFYSVVFFAMVAERENRFTLDEIITTIREKMVRRHPHVFGDAKSETIEEIENLWNEIKKGENKDKGRESAVDGIPKTLSGLMRGQKLLKKISKHPSPPREINEKMTQERELATEVIALMKKANEVGIDLESAVRYELHEEEKHFRDWELQP